MTTETVELCQICHRDEEWHRIHRPRHAFVGPDDDPRLRLDTPTPPDMSVRGDPVLRLAMVKAGVLTDMQIFEAEVWVRQAAERGMAVVVDNGEFKLLTIEEWITWTAAGRL